MGTTLSGSASRTESMAKEKAGKCSPGSIRWRKRFQRNRRQLKNEQIPFKAASQAGNGALSTSNLTAATASMHVLTDSFAPASHDSTNLGPSSTEGTSCPVATPAAHLLEMARIETQTEAYFRIKKHEFEELGCMRFHFDIFHKALDESRTTRRPVLIMQAEIPGDTDAGSDIFSHPLIVEATDSLFTTVNKDKDYSCSASRSASMKSCRTRVGFYTESGHEIVESLSADMLTRAGIAEAMIETLETCFQDVPKYLRLLYEEERGRIKLGPVGLPVPCCHRAVIGMKGSTLGEVEFAGLDSVISTRAGFVTRQQVIEVIYDWRCLSFGSLVDYALKREVGDVIYYQTNDERIAAWGEIKCFQESSKVIYYQTNDERMAAGLEIAPVQGKRSKVTEFLGTIQLDDDSKRALWTSPLRFVPLTDLQATRANRLVHLNRCGEAMYLLNPRQKIIFMQKNSFKDAIDVPILPAWMSLCDQEFPSDSAPKTDPADSDSSTEIGTVLNLYR